ncbi:MAG: WecB/TagA/CpsF family glycosyltransferase [bacterium]|nr:WecB/TagA/CpsF family glycosyltransferase [bacterium]
MKTNKVQEINNLERLLDGRKRRKLPIVGIRALGAGLFLFLFEVIANIVVFLISFFILLFFGMPVFLFLLVRKLFTSKDIISRKIIIGKQGKKISILYFNAKNYIVKNIPLFYHVLTGKLAVVGVSIKEYSDLNRVVGDSYLYSSKPGIISLWYVRQSSKVTHEGNFSTDWEYVYKKSLFSNIIIILKSIPAMLYNSSAEEFKPKIHLFNLWFDNLSMKEAIDNIDSSISSRKKSKVYFVNPDCLNKIFDDKEYYHVLKNGDFIFPDGIGINIACKILKDPLKENINGTDMLPYICELAVKNDNSIFLLGGKPGVAEKMKNNLKYQYEGLNISGVNDGYFNKESESNIIIEKINSSNAEILLIAFGAPAQEKWIDKYKNDINAHILMGVGGLFDFYSGNIKRAPKWMREIGLEWVYRMMQEPRRLWRRYVIGNPVFIFRVLNWKFSKYKK